MIRSCFTYTILENICYFFTFLPLHPLQKFHQRGLWPHSPWGLHLWKFESAYQTHVLNITLRRQVYLWLVWKLLHLNHLYQYFFNSHQLFRHFRQWFVCLMVFNATFNNIAAITWQSVLLKPEDPEKTTDLLESGLLQLFTR